MIDLGGDYDKISLTSGSDHLDLSSISVRGVELIDAGAGNDIIVASAANDVLKGGLGNDTFAFRDDFGHDIITDFELGSGSAHDLLDVSDAGFIDFSDVLAAADEFGSGTVITVDETRSLTLSGVSLQHLTADHFIFA